MCSTSVSQVWGPCTSYPLWHLACHALAWLPLRLSHVLISLPMFSQITSKLILTFSQFWRPKSDISITGPQLRCWQSCVPSRGRSCSVLVPVAGGCHHSLACGLIIVMSRLASSNLSLFCLYITFSPMCLCQISLSLQIIRTLG